MFQKIRTEYIEGIGWLLFFIIAILVLSNFNIGPFTIRVYATLLMLAYIVFNFRKFRRSSIIPLTNSFIKLYTTFLIIFLFCLIVNGEITEYDYFRRLMAFHLVCFVAFFAIKLKVNSRKHIMMISTLLICILLIDSVLTILQATGNSTSWSLAEMLSPSNTGEIEDKVSSRDTVLGFSIIPGIFGNVVRNAFYLASLSPLTMMFFKNNRIYVRLFAIMTLISSLFAIFVTQQRAAFYLLLLVILIYLPVVFMHKPIYLFISFIGLLFLGDNIDLASINFDFGRLTDSDNASRNRIWEYAYSFIPQHLLFGGPVEFQRLAGLSAHNIVFDSLIFSGIGGFIVLMIFNFKVGIICVKIIIDYIRERCSLMTFSLAMAMTTCTLYGFTHNTSVLTGEVIIFILLSLMLKSIQLDNIRK